MYLIVGLGNPGREYENTRHNLGFQAVDRLAKDLGISVSKDICNSLTGQAQWEGHRVVLAKPQTFMNLSGDSVAELVKWFKIEEGHLIVIHDDLDIEPGKLKVRPHGNSAGHNGVESVIQRMKTTEFIRIRIGIGRATLADDNAKYVLAHIPAGEKDMLQSSVNSAAEAALTIVKSGIDAAMNSFNK
jgi:peptidyl-tRNA hydrolase, PTH1 family